MKINFKEHPKSDGSFLAEIKLNRPEVLNALDMETTACLYQQLMKWKNNPLLSLVFFHAEGTKAFCVGGDVKNLYYIKNNPEKNKHNLQDQIQTFCENNYRIDYLMATYPKPIVTWGHGFIMGIGTGIFWASSHPIVTNSTRLSMPEMMIGLVPDAGSSYHLSHVPHRIGWYIALTAHQLNSKEIQYVNWSDLYFEDSEKQKVFQTLISHSFTNKKELTHILKRTQTKGHCPSQLNWLKKNSQIISSVVSSKQLHTIYKEFQKSHEKTDQKWGKNKQNFLHGSPITLGVICQQLSKGEKMNLKQALQMELVLALNFIQQPNFLKGVRARFIDKNNQPLWEPNSVEKVSRKMVQACFTPQKGWVNPLNNL